MWLELADLVALADISQLSLRPRDVTSQVQHSNLRALGSLEKHNVVFSFC